MCSKLWIRMFTCGRNTFRGWLGVLHQVDLSIYLLIGLSKTGICDWSSSTGYYGFNPRPHTPGLKRPWIMRCIDVSACAGSFGTSVTGFTGVAVLLLNNTERFRRSSDHGATGDLTVKGTICSRNSAQENLLYAHDGGTLPAGLPDSPESESRNLACWHTGEGDDLRPCGEPPAYSSIRPTYPGVPVWANDDDQEKKNGSPMVRWVLCSCQLGWQEVQEQSVLSKTCAASCFAFLHGVHSAFRRQG